MPEMLPSPGQAPAPESARSDRFAPRILPYAAATAGVLTATGCTMAIRGVMGSSVSILFFPTVLFTAIYGGYGPALLATVLSTAALAYFFINPGHALAIGADDVIRLGAFAVVAIVTAHISSALKRAERAQRRTLGELRGALGTLQKVSGWPVFIDATIDGAASRLLTHAATVVPCARALVTWEADDEPWVYLASSEGGAAGVQRLSPTEMVDAVPPELAGATFVAAARPGEATRVQVTQGNTVRDWTGNPLPPAVASRLAGHGIASAPFEVEHLSGRLYFSGLESTAVDLVPLAALVAHEVGSSLERLHLHHQLRQLAVREERIRLARDLHDGVLQSLTGIRLRLQAVADDPDAPPAERDSLLAIERAIAIEQRELRLFIEDLRPVSEPALPGGALSLVLAELRDRVSKEWNTPVTVRISPADVVLDAAAHHTLVMLVREAVINALKHARPTRVAVDVEPEGGDRLRVVVTDDGRGFPFRGRLDQDQLAERNAGPVSLRERVASIGGSLVVDSTPGGSRVEFSLPVR